MRLIQALDRRQLSYLLDPVEYHSPSFSTEGPVLDVIEKHIRLGNHIKVYGDYDDDGFCCLECFKETFRHIGYKNYSVFNYRTRTHRVDTTLLSECLRTGVRLVIICDTGSSQVDLLERLVTYGIDVVVLDHHETVYQYKDYPENCYIINTMLENRLLKKDVFRVSAGALTYIICEKLIDRLGYRELPAIRCIALRSLYADSMDMSNDLNRSIYYHARKVGRARYPSCILDFMGEGEIISRRFISYSLSPKINSLFRTGNTYLLNKYLNRENTPTIDVDSLVRQIVGVTDEYRPKIELAADLISADILENNNYNNFVLGNLSSVLNVVDIPEDILHHFTGVVANKLCVKFRKTAIVYADQGSYIKASLRDTLNRNYLKLFKTFCSAEGHASAFGINIPYKMFHNFVEDLKILDAEFSINSVSNSPIQATFDESQFSDEELFAMALFNEFSGQNIPIAFYDATWSRHLKPLSNYRNQENTSFSYKIGGEYFLNSKTRIYPGVGIWMKPYLKSNKRDVGYHTVGLETIERR